MINLFDLLGSGDAVWRHRYGWKIGSSNCLLHKEFTPKTISQRVFKLLLCMLSLKSITFELLPYLRVTPVGILDLVSTLVQIPHCTRALPKPLATLLHFSSGPVSWRHFMPYTIPTIWCLSTNWFQGKDGCDSHYAFFKRILMIGKSNIFSDIAIRWMCLSLGYCV